MNLISRKLERPENLHYSEIYAGQTWDLFEQEIKEKEVFVFGAGAGLDYFLSNCCRHLKIAGVVDNDETKQGLSLGWCCAEAWRTEYESMLIQSPNILKNYDCDSVMVLITVVNRFDGILVQLKRMGIKNIFLLLMLEGNRRKIHKVHGEENPDQIKQKYTDWCYQQPIEKKIVMDIGEYGGHIRAITKQLLKINYGIDIVWLVTHPDVDAPKGVRLVPKKNWKRFIFEMATAKIWLFDNQIWNCIDKRSGQIYIQTKHWSSITLKKFGLEDKSFCVSSEIEQRIRMDGARTDYLLSGSRFDEETCRRGWAIQGKAIRVGSPRSDVLFDKEIKGQVRAAFQIPEETHILLYAPTFRRRELQNGSEMTVTLDMEAVLYAMRKKFGGNWVLFVRLHPLIRFEDSGLEERDNIINVGNYQNGEELVAASDVMITDYSSIMFEAAFIKQPVFLYAPDLEEFLTEDREFLIDFRQLPFATAKSNQELCRCIMNYDIEEYESKVDAFLKKYDVREDGMAGKRAADFIAALLNETYKEAGV